MTNQDSVNTQVIPKLVAAEDFVDGSDNTQAYILTSITTGTSSIGYKAIVSNLEDNGVLSQNIKGILYRGSSNIGDTPPGILGKAVVTWTPNTAGDGAVLDVYIQSNNPIFEQGYDSNGDPVGAAACAGNNKHKRQSGACASPGAAADDSGLATTTTAAEIATTNTPATTPTPTCFQQYEDPDQGIQQQGCICNQGIITKTLPLLATGVDASSCGYTDISTQSTIAITANFGSAVTNNMVCSVCSPIADNGATCTSLPNCLPQTPTATIQIGSSPVPVGTLTSSSLSAAISSAISTLCPPVTQTTTSTTCDETSKVTIGGITYIAGGFLATNGELPVQIDSSGYNDTALLKPLAGMAALSISSSATGSNCKNESYMVEQDKKAKRWYSPAIDLGLSSLPFSKRDHPFPVSEEILLCNSGHFASPQIYSQWYVISIQS